MSTILLLLALCGAEPDQPASVDLVVPGAHPAAVRFVISLGEQRAEQAWTEFLDHWLVMFDADEDGALNASESENVPALSNSTGNVVRLDVKSADANNDGLLNRDEIDAYYRKRGLSGIQTLPVQNEATSIQASATFWRLLDVNHDDKLSKSELDAASQLLNRWDLNEDECLTFDELPPASATAALAAATVSWSTANDTVTDGANIVSLPLILNSLKSPPSLDPSKDLTTKFNWLDRQRLRLTLPEATVTVLLGQSSVQRIAGAQQYLLGEINMARGDRPLLDARAVQADPNLEWLTAFIPLADRDGDKQLNDAELKTVVDLLGEGAAVQVNVVVLFRGHNLFDHLDANADNQLDLRELNAASTLLSKTADSTRADDKPLSHDDIPLSITVKVQRGPVNGRFGRLRIARSQAEPTATAPHSTKRPRWFTAMDRNHDEALSPAEFLGTPSQFGQLDRNADGMISDDEIQ